MALLTVQIQQQITAGETLARKIKQVIYPDEEWTPKLAFRIGYDMKAVKRVARLYYPGVDELKLIHEVSSWPEQDIRDALEFKHSDKEVTCNERNQPNAIGQHMQRSMASEKRNS